MTAGIRGCRILDHNVICNGNYLINLKKIKVLFSIQFSPVSFLNRISSVGQPRGLLIRASKVF